MLDWNVKGLYRNCIIFMIVEVWYRVREAQQAYRDFYRCSWRSSEGRLWSTFRNAALLFFLNIKKCRSPLHLCVCLFSLIFLRFVFVTSPFKQQLSMWECLTLAQSSRAVSNPFGGVAMTFCLSNTLYLHSGSRLIVSLWLHRSDRLLFGLILHGWKCSFLF